MWPNTNLVNKKISLLIPARNEEKFIERLLMSIEGLSLFNYQLEVLLGNDASRDLTGEIMDTFCSKNENWTTYHLKDTDQNTLKGKVRVLAHLAEKASGEIFLFTDADIKLPKNWLKGMLQPFEANSKLGVVVGITRMEDKSLFSKMQSMEWLSVLGIARLLSNIGIPTTGMGNNMAVSQKAYHAVGGYEKIGFSIVEDYALFKAVISKGFDFEQALSKDVEAFTIPPDGFLAQRNRWIKGAIQSKSKFVIPAFLQSFALPVYLLLTILGFWKIALSVWLTFSFATLVGLFVMERKSGIRTNYELGLLFGLYVPVSWFFQIVYFLRNRNKVIWKERTYN